MKGAWRSSSSTAPGSPGGRSKHRQRSCSDGAWGSVHGLQHCQASSAQQLPGCARGAHLQPQRPPRRAPAPHRGQRSARCLQHPPCPSPTRRRSPPSRPPPLVLLAPCPCPCFPEPAWRAPARGPMSRWPGGRAQRRRRCPAPRPRPPLRRSPTRRAWTGGRPRLPRRCHPAGPAQGLRPPRAAAPWLQQRSAEGGERAAAVMQRRQTSGGEAAAGCVGANPCWSCSPRATRRPAHQCWGAGPGGACCELRMRRASEAAAGAGFGCQVCSVASELVNEGSALAGA